MFWGPHLVLAHLVAAHQGPIEDLVPDNYYRAVYENLQDNIIASLVQAKSNHLLLQGESGEGAPDPLLHLEGVVQWLVGWL